MPDPLAHAAPILPQSLGSAWHLHGSRLETFNDLFPAAYWYGADIGASEIGPQNAIVLQPELDLHPAATLGVYLKTLFIWREDTADALHTIGFPVLSGSTSSQRYVGAEPELLITQQFGRHLEVTLQYFHFFRGGFLTNNQVRTKDVDYFSAWMSYTF